MSTSLIDTSASEAIRIWEQEKANEAQTSLPDLSHPRSLAPVRPEYPTLRAAIFDVMDGGWKCSSGCDIKHPWSFDPYDESDWETKQRQRFADVVLDRLATLQRTRTASGD